MGLAYLQYREAGIDFGEGPLAKAAGCARVVDALAPGSAHAWQLRGWIQYARGRIPEAVGRLKEALALGPSSTDGLHLLINCYLISGRVSMARPLIGRALAVDPLTALTQCMPGWADLLEGQTSAALNPYRRMFEMDPHNPMARMFYAWVLALNGRLDDIAGLIETLPAEISSTVPGRLTIFLSRAVAGCRAEAEAAVTSDVEAAAAATDVFARFLAHGYVAIGMADQALRWLTVAVDRGFINYPFLARHDPMLASIRGDGRFRELLEHVRTRWEQFQG